MRLAALVCMAAAALGARGADEPEMLREVVVLSRRPADTGVEQTRFDSTALHETVALSMADVLAYNSGVYVKNYGRATQSTVAFRGTSASHTRVSWNGLDINSPMLGSTDFSTIPSMLVDQARLLHGSSSLTEGSGGLGGAVALSSTADSRRGFHAAYTQGIGSFSTFDENLALSWGNDRVRLTTRAVYASSPNDFKYRNHDKKENIYDDNHNIIGSYYPEERNRSGAYHDLHVMQDVAVLTRGAGRFDFSGWYMSSDRELPLLTTDYADDTPFENKRREQTVRLTAAWTRMYARHKFSARGGYAHSWSAYDYRRDPGSGTLVAMSRSRSSVDTYMARATYEWLPAASFHLTAEANMGHNSVRSVDGTSGDASAVLPFTPGLHHSRTDLSARVSAAWRPTRRLGLSVLLRQDTYGGHVPAPVPAVFADYILWDAAQLTVKGSASRNHRSPTMNDLYAQPGGNPDLRDETGWTYDLGLSAARRFGRADIDLSANWFDSRIDDWILWLPTVKGYYTPRNIRRVHAYGIESRAGAAIDLGRGWQADLQGSFSWTPSINRADPTAPDDIAPGNQLPYVPRQSASATARIAWRGWALTYKWCHYSRRFTQSSGDQSLSGYLPAYYMSNIVIEKPVKLRPCNLMLKLAVNNLFDEEYLSVLSRPMPGIHFEFFIGVSI